MSEMFIQAQVVAHGPKISPQNMCASGNDAPDFSVLFYAGWNRWMDA